MSKNSKVTLFIGSLTGGGAERVTCNIANYLVNHGYIVDVITMSDVKDTYILDQKVNKKVLIQKQERKNKISDFMLRYKRLKKIVIEDKECDCYIVMLPITALMLFSLKKYTNAKMIFSERNDPASYSFIIQKLMKSIASKANGVVFQTATVKKWYGNCVKNAIVIPNAINSDFLDMELSKKKEAKIVAVGRLKKQKNYPLLIQSFAQISNEFDNYKLYIYGDGEEKETLITLVDRLNLKDRVLFKGYVSNVGEKLKDASLFAMSSDHEGMPNALIEAMALGLPCVCTDCDGGGARELIKHKENGFLVPKGNVEEFSDALRTLLKDEKLRAEVSKNAKEISKRLAPEKIYNEWESFVKSNISKEG